MLYNVHKIRNHGGMWVLVWGWGGGKGFFFSFYATEAYVN